MRYLFILLLTGCVTEQGASVDLQHEHSQLKCVGYCDLLITDKNAEVSANAKVEIKRPVTPKPDGDGADPDNK